MNQNEIPNDFDALALRMAELMLEGSEWGKINHCPLFAKYPQYNEVQEIGKKLYEMGGKELMQKAYAAVADSVSHSKMSQYWWDGIGSWRA